MDFVPEYGWVNVPDVTNPPPGAKKISAADLLRYERGLAEAKAELEGVGVSVDSKVSTAKAEAISAASADATAKANAARDAAIAASPFRLDTDGVPYF